MLKILSKNKFVSLILIYAIYISLGIPDSLFGVAWPSVQDGLAVPTFYGSLILAIILILAAISSISYTYLEKYISVGIIVVISCLLTAFGLALISISTTFIMLCISAIPLGLGAGAVDAAINNFVSENLNAKHMIWLNGAWSIGALIGPIVFSITQSNNLTWQSSFIIIAIIQSILAIFLFVFRNQWSKSSINDEKYYLKENILAKNEMIFRISIIVLVSGIEIGINLWMSTYLQKYLGMSTTITGLLMSSYYLSTTLGRFALGFVSQYIKIKKIMSMGLTTALLGFILVSITHNIFIFVVAISLLGIGVCSIYPFMIFENHSLFKKEIAQKIVSYQIASYLIGSLVFSFLIGLLMSYNTISLYPLILFIIVLTALFIRIRLNKSTN